MQESSPIFWSQCYCLMQPNVVQQLIVWIIRGWLMIDFEMVLSQHNIQYGLAF